MNPSFKLEVVGLGPPVPTADSLTVAPLQSKTRFKAHIRTFHWRQPQDVQSISYRPSHSGGHWKLVTS